MTAGYEREELDKLQSTIVELRWLSEEEVRSTTAAVRQGRCPERLAAFWSLTASHGDDRAEFGRHLFRKLSSDPLLSSYSFYGLFPATYARIYLNGERPEIMFEGRTRGRVAILRFGDGDGIVIKPVQSAREDVIARLAGEGFIGPSQFPSLEGFLSEEWVVGRFFTVLTEEAVFEEAMYAIGERLGLMLAELHARQIYYNDATVSDPDGRSHLIIDDKANFGGGAVPNCRLIDFGVSVLLDNFPDLGPEEVYNLVRTTPEFRLLSRMGLSGPEVRNFLAQYRRRLGSVSKEEILARDLRFTEEGLRQTAWIFGESIVAPFREGFHMGYG